MKAHFYTTWPKPTPQVYESRHVKRGDPLRPDKITEMVALYIKQSKHHKAKAKVTKTVEQADLWNEPSESTTQ